MVNVADSERDYKSVVRDERQNSLALKKGAKAPEAVLGTKPGTSKVAMERDESIEADEAELVAALLRLDQAGLAEWLGFSSLVHQRDRDQERSRGGSRPDGQPH